MPTYEIIITPNNANLMVAETQQFTANIIGSDSSKVPATVNWTISPSDGGDITIDGLLTPILQGSLVLTATPVSGILSPGIADITVVPAYKKSVNVASGTIVATTRDKGTKTYAVPSYTYTSPSSAGFYTETLAWAYRDQSGKELTGSLPGLVLFSGTTLNRYAGGGFGSLPYDDNGVIKLHTFTSLNGIITHAADQRKIGGIIGDNIPAGTITTTHLASSVIESIGAQYLKDLKDVIEIEPEDGDILIYSSTFEKWIAQTNSAIAPPVYTLVLEDMVTILTTEDGTYLTV